MTDNIFRIGVESYSSIIPSLEEWGVNKKVKIFDLDKGYHETYKLDIGFWFKSDNEAENKSMGYKPIRYGAPTSAGISKDGLRQIDFNNLSLLYAHRHKEALEEFTYDDIIYVKTIKDGWFAIDQKKNQINNIKC